MLLAACPDSLLSDSSHYVFPDAQSMVQYLELYQDPAITSLVVTQTAAAAVSSDPLWPPS